MSAVQPKPAAVMVALFKAGRLSAPECFHAKPTGGHANGAVSPKWVFRNHRLTNGALAFVGRSTARAKAFDGKGPRERRTRRGWAGVRW